MNCQWCKKPNTKRLGSKFCSTKCRQSSHRFRVGVAFDSSNTRRMKFAYADPVYPGLAHLYPENREVDHGQLIDRLRERFPDGWALSTSAEGLAEVLRWCPSDTTRVCCWLRGTRSPISKRPTKTWEPVVVVGGRDLPKGEKVPDSLVWAGGKQHTHPDAMIGMKPCAFSEWVFRLLGAQLGDELSDIFPGSGAVSRAWDIYQSQEPRGLPSRYSEAIGVSSVPKGVRRQ